MTINFLSDKNVWFMHEWDKQYHFDYTNLIGRGFALTAPDGMYNF